jgi:hypothetical protein
MVRALNLRSMLELLNAAAYGVWPAPNAPNRGRFVRFFGIHWNVGIPDQHDASKKSGLFSRLFQPAKGTADPVWAEAWGANRLRRTQEAQHVYSPLPYFACPTPAGINPAALTPLNR